MGWGNERGDSRDSGFCLGLIRLLRRCPTRWGHCRACLVTVPWESESSARGAGSRERASFLHEWVESFASPLLPVLPSLVLPCVYVPLCCPFHHHLIVPLAFIFPCPPFCPIHTHFHCIASGHRPEVDQALPVGVAPPCRSPKQSPWLSQGMTRGP